MASDVHGGGRGDRGRASSGRADRGRADGAPAPSVMTVLGPIEPDSLGVTLPHEHLFLDLTNQFTEPRDPSKRLLAREKVNAENSDLLRKNPYAIKDNLLLSDMKAAVEEAGAFKEAGGRTIVDCTSIGIRRDARKLRRLAGATGLNVIAGCGYYTHDTHPPEMRGWSAERIADEMVKDLTEGIDGTDIRAGVIGEIGTSDPIHPDEEKVLIAAALAHRRTGVGIQVHTYPWGKTGPSVVDALLPRGVHPSKIVVCHVDMDLDLDYLKDLLERGVLVQFDNFGKEFSIPEEERGFAGGVFATDAERAGMLAKLLSLGYASQLLMTNDICLKCMLHSFGGKGYDHVLRGVRLMLEQEGVSGEVFRQLMVDNPRRFLTPSASRGSWR